MQYPDLHMNIDKNQYNSSEPLYPKDMTEGGLYRLYKNSKNSIFHHYIEQFLKFCKETFQRRQPSDDINIEINQSRNPSQSSSNKTTIINNYSHWPWFWFPQQYREIYHHYPLSMNMNKSDKDDKKKKDEDEFGTGMKIILFMGGITALSTSAYYLTIDWVDIMKLIEGKKKMKQCRNYLIDIKNQNNQLYGNNHVCIIEELIDHFTKIYGHIYTYRKINFTSKILFSLSVIGSIFGGLFYGPIFYAGTNLVLISCSIGGSMVMYIVNRQYYKSMYEKEDKEISEKLANMSQTLLLTELVNNIPSVNLESLD